MTQSVLGALASPRRQEMLRLMWTRERTAGEIRDAMPDVSFAAVSLHLRLLANAGLVHVRAQGRYRHYIAHRQGLGPLATVLETMWEDALWRLNLAAELEYSRRGPRPRRRRARKPGGTPS